MISKSALEALNKLVELAEKFSKLGGAEVPGDSVQLAWEVVESLPALRSLLEPTEARAEAEGRSDMESIRFAATVATDRILKEYARMVLKSRDFMPEKMRDIIAEEFYSLASPVTKAETQPVDMLLYCPKCNRQHIDGAQPHQDWTNPPHRSHKCRFPDCGHIWRPADVATNGVLALDTSGHADGSPNPKDFAHPSPQPEAATIDAEAAASEPEAIRLHNLISKRTEP